MLSQVIKSFLFSLLFIFIFASFSFGGTAGQIPISQGNGQPDIHQSVYGSCFLNKSGQMSVPLIGQDPAIYGASWAATGVPSAETVSMTLNGTTTISGVGDFTAGEYGYIPHGSGTACTINGSSCSAPSGLVMYVMQEETVMNPVAATTLVFGHPIATNESQSVSPSPNGTNTSFSGTTTNGTIDPGSFQLFITPASGTGVITLRERNGVLDGNPIASGTLTRSTGAWTVTFNSAQNQKTYAPATGTTFTATYAYSGTGTANFSGTSLTGQVIIKDHWAQTAYQQVSSSPSYGQYTLSCTSGVCTATFNSSNVNEYDVMDVYYTLATPPSGTDTLCSRVADQDGPLHGTSPAESQVCLSSVAADLPTSTNPVYIGWTQTTGAYGSYVWENYTYHAGTPTGYFLAGGTYASDSFSLTDILDYGPNYWIEWGTNAYSCRYCPTTPPASALNEDLFFQTNSISGSNMNITVTAGGSVGTGSFTGYHNDGPPIRLTEEACVANGPPYACKIVLPETPGGTYPLMAGQTATTSIQADYIPFPNYSFSLSGTGQQTNVTLFEDGGGTAVFDATAQEGRDWKVSYGYAAAYKIIPALNNPGAYAFESNYTSSCTTSSTEPSSWNQTYGGTTSDNTCTWTNVGSFGEVNASGTFSLNNIHLFTDNSIADALFAFTSYNGNYLLTDIYSSISSGNLINANRNTEMVAYVMSGQVSNELLYGRRGFVCETNCNGLYFNPSEVYLSFPGLFTDAPFEYGQGSYNITFDTPAIFENTPNIVRPTNMGDHYINGFNSRNVYSSDIGTVTLTTGHGQGNNLATPQPRGIAYMGDGGQWLISDGVYATGFNIGFWYGLNYNAGSLDKFDSLNIGNPFSGTTNVMSGYGFFQRLNTIQITNGYMGLKDGIIGVFGGVQNVNFSQFVKVTGSTADLAMAPNYSRGTDVCLAGLSQQEIDSNFSTADLDQIFCFTQGTSFLDSWTKLGLTDLRTPPYTLTESNGGTVTPNLFFGSMQFIPITGCSDSFTVALPTGIQSAGQYWFLIFENNCGSTYTGSISKGTGMKWASGNPAIGTNGQYNIFLCGNLTTSNTLCLASGAM